MNDFEYSMKPQLIFTKSKPTDFIGANKIFCFLNLDSLWYFKNNKLYRLSITKENNINFPDGKMISRNLKIKQIRGSFFTKFFLKQKSSRDKKHFFIGNATVTEIVENSNLKETSIRIYNPPYIQDLEFSEQEQEKILIKLLDFKPDFVWVCVGSPKQEILSNQLYEKYKTDYFNVGAALDFLLNKKEEAPEIWSKLGIEWFYRLITDFKHTRKKVWRHLLALKYIRSLELDG